ncbi:hypothetical protein D8T48_11785 [Vibrio vulnificus]|nr:hypothetical protein D8T48_11785 [Vibrio vulnificus]
MPIKKDLSAEVFFFGGGGGDPHPRRCTNSTDILLLKRRLNNQIKTAELRFLSSLKHHSSNQIPIDDDKKERGYT